MPPAVAANYGGLAAGAVAVAVVAILASSVAWRALQPLAYVRLFFGQLDAATEFLPPEVRGALKGTFYLSVPMSIFGAVGSIFYQSYGIFHARFSAFVEKRCKVSLIFKSADKHYDVVIDYIGAKCAVETGKLLASTTPRSKKSFSEMLSEWLGGKTKTPTLYYQPDLAEFANYFMWQDREGVSHKIWLSRHVEKPHMRTDSSSKQRDPETLILSIWWSTDSQPLKDFMADALKTMLEDNGDGKVDIYVKNHWLPVWSKAISKERRDRETVVLDGKMADYVVDDLNHFFSKKTADWYHNAGIPYRRGYLLYGPPGCGKTSFAQVLAGELGLDVCLMNLSNHDMQDDDLAELLRNAPPKAMLLLEDVDAIFVERASGSSKKGGGVSFSGLLNALDGAAAQEGCVIVLTTNHKEKLDEALIRPGRCDVHVQITKASKDQAKRMFNRFFAKEAKVKSVDEGCGLITASTAHGFRSGDALVYKRAQGSPLTFTGIELDSEGMFYAGVPGAPGAAQTKLQLYASREHALMCGVEGRISVAGGFGARLQCLTEAAVRFSGRIPDRQVSMAKLQGHLMKQKLLAEQHFTSLRDAKNLPAHVAALDPVSEEYKLVYNEEVVNFAAEGAVINVHELLDVKVEAEEVKIPVFDHLRRVGVHRFAPLFEYFGVRTKRELSKDFASRMETWHPDLKIPGAVRDRLVALINGAEEIEKDYALADLSVLRDRFVSAFQGTESNQKEQGKLAENSPPPVPLGRYASTPGSGASAPTRVALIRQGSQGLKQEQLTILDMAHQFQEQLEENGKTDVSLWQLDLHFQRFEGDPTGALKNCSQLKRTSADRTREERAVPWVTTFEFLRRLGLEMYSFALEDAGCVLWSELKALSKDELKEKGAMSPKDAAFCHAVLSCNSDRPDMLRQFQLPEFGDVMDIFSLRFPSARKETAREFALQITDTLGEAAFSHIQIQAYLNGAKTPASALQGLGDGLPSFATAQAARVRPDQPPPAKESEDWVHVWLKAEGLEGLSGMFLGQALATREDVLGASLGLDALKQMGIQKLGEQCKILRMIEAEKAKVS